MLRCRNSITVDQLGVKGAGSLTAQPAAVVAFFGDTRHAEVAARLEGFKRFAATHNCAVVAEVPCEFSFPAGAAAVARVVADAIALDGVFAASDSIAMGVVRALIDRGHRVPEDVSVIGYDDTPIGASFVPALTTVRQDWAAGPWHARWC